MGRSIGALELITNRWPDLLYLWPDLHSYFGIQSVRSQLRARSFTQGEPMPTMDARSSTIARCVLGKSSAPQRRILTAAAWPLALCLGAAGTHSAVAQHVTEPAVVPTVLAGPCETRFDSN